MYEVNFQSQLLHLYCRILYQQELRKMSRVLDTNIGIGTLTLILSLFECWRFTKSRDGDLRLLLNLDEYKFFSSFSDKYRAQCIH